MKFRLLWVGKTQESWVKTGIDEYAGRVRRYFPLEIGEAKEEKGATGEQAREREAERLLKLLPATAKLVLLDETGAQLTSPEFAALIGATEQDTALQLAQAQARNVSVVRDFLLEVLSAADPARAGGKPPGQVTVQEAVDAAASNMGSALEAQPETKVPILITLADVYSSLDQVDGGA